MRDLVPDIVKSTSGDDQLAHLRLAKELVVDADDWPFKMDDRPKCCHFDSILGGSNISHTVKDRFESLTELHLYFNPCCLRRQGNDLPVSASTSMDKLTALSLHIVDRSADFPPPAATEPKLQYTGWPSGDAHRIAVRTDDWDWRRNCQLVNGSGHSSRRRGNQPVE